ncbi:carboxypeptidase-like regulatory domain-containing protein [Ochrovirga pacifica]|uniref:carboxypeptidase-like regulatory domain-containing protein n=1 Tax=Ochrovirga pacifica TaxID=1042376 RepID=UPI0002557765|nr:carboxypeptidase-like regulatory domain-containing protein [Ochrovirga pacifica]
MIKSKILWIVILLMNFVIQAQTKKTVVQGTIYDETNETIPFVTIGIVNKTIGTASTMDGEFALMITDNEMQDTLYVSGLGFDTYKIKIQDYLAKKDRKIVLKENVVNLETVELLHPIDYVEKALDNLKKNTLSKTHVKEILYRRAATEEGKSKFFVENYIKLKGRGPAYWVGQVQVTESRKSADYRFWKRTQWRHAVLGLNDTNPLTPNDSEHARNLRKFAWKKTGSSSYEGEDVVILEGKNPDIDWEKIILYVGIDKYQIFRIERGRSLFIYKKHNNGKVYLSYYKNQWRFPKSHIPRNLWGTAAETLEYKSEAFVLNVITDKKKMKIKPYGVDIDMGSLDLPYHPEFWANLSLPPDTKFYKRIKSELEGLYGVPLEKQFELVNK